MRAAFPCPATGEQCSRPDCSKTHCVEEPVLAAKLEAASESQRKRELDAMLKRPATFDAKRFLKLLGL